MAAEVGEAPSDWLSKIIQQKRASIKKLLPFRERKAEAEAVVEAIKGHPKGAPLAANPDLYDVVYAAIGVANKCEREAEANPKIATASPAIQASWFVFDELGLERPEAEF